MRINIRNEVKDFGPSAQNISVPSETPSETTLGFVSSIEIFDLRHYAFFMKFIEIQDDSGTKNQVGYQNDFNVYENRSIRISRAFW